MATLAPLTLNLKRGSLDAVRSYPDTKRVPTKLKPQTHNPDNFCFFFVFF